MFELFEAEETALTLHTPLDALIAEYRKKCDDIKRIAAYVAGETDVMGYFLEGARVEHNVGNYCATSLFQVEPAIRALDAFFWSRAMRLTDCLELMPADKRNEWNEQIRKHQTPPFEPDTVRATLESMISQRAVFFSERVDGIFRALSEVHLTNQPQGFSKRMIISWVIGGYGSINHGRANYIHDLRCVIARFMGRDEPRSNMTYTDLDRIVRCGAYGQWHLFDGGSLRIRVYKVGTAHLEVHPDMAYRLNQVLAYKNPSAIPSEFRRKPAKPKKEHVLVRDLVPFEVLAALGNGRLDTTGQRLSFYEKLPAAAVEVLNYIGGVAESGYAWAFEYHAEGVLYELQRTGIMPEKRSHQYYPTTEKLARIAVELAEPQDDDEFLEPEAGQGGIADHLPAERLTCVEISALHCAVLKAKGYKTVCADFLSWNPGRTFSKAVMNPPFSDGRALDHVQHAASLVRPGGRVVAILPASMRGKTLIDGWEHTWSEVYQGEFKGTGVAVAIVRLDSLNQ